MLPRIGDVWTCGSVEADFVFLILDDVGHAGHAGRFVRAIRLVTGEVAEHFHYAGMDMPESWRRMAP